MEAPASPGSPRSRTNERRRSRSRSFSLTRNSSKSQADMEAIANEALDAEGSGGGGLKRMFSFSKKSTATANGTGTAAGTPKTPNSEKASPTTTAAPAAAHTKPAAADHHHHKAAAPAKPAMLSIGNMSSFMKKAAVKPGVPAKQSLWQQCKGKLQSYKVKRLPFTLSYALAAALVILAVGLYYAPKGGPRLIRRDAPLVSGDSLKPGQYINTCTGVMSPVMKCKPMYFEMALDGELGLYKGSSPADNQGKLWSTGTRTKSPNGAKSDLVATYSDGKLSVVRGDRIVWKYPKNRLPQSYFKGDWPLK